MGLTGFEHKASGKAGSACISREVGDFGRSMGIRSLCHQTVVK